MAAGSSNINLVAQRYVNALLEIAEQNGLSREVEKDLQDLSAMIAGSEDLRTLIRTPLIGRAQQKAAVLALAEKAKFQKATGNFLGVLADNRRLGVVPAVIEGFQAALRARRGEVEAKIETAFPLSATQTDALQKELSKAVGAGVTLSVAVNKDLLGGMIVTVGSRMIDDSVRRKLERLQRAMCAGSNENQIGLKDAG